MQSNFETLYVEELYNKFLLAKTESEKESIIQEILHYEENFISALADIYNDILRDYNLDTNYQIEYFTNLYRKVILRKKNMPTYKLRTLYLTAVRNRFASARKKIAKLENSATFEDEILNKQVLIALNERRKKFLITRDNSLAQELSVAEFKKLEKLANDLFLKTGEDYYCDIVNMYLRFLPKHLDCKPHEFNQLFYVKFMRFSERKIELTKKASFVTYSGLSHLESLLGADQIMYDMKRNVIKKMMINRFMNELFKKVPQDRLNRLIRCEVMNATLNEVAISEGVSRERINQKNKSTIKFINKFMPKRMLEDTREFMLEEEFEKCMEK